MIITIRIFNFTTTTTTTNDDNNCYNDTEYYNPTTDYNNNDYSKNYITYVSMFKKYYDYNQYQYYHH